MTARAPDPQALLPLIDDQLRLAGVLETLLRDEEQALLGSDLAQLAALVAQKRSAAEALEQASAALSRHTDGDPHRAVDRADIETRQRWQALGQSAERLRRQNLVNGALLNERQNRLRWVLQRAAPEATALYAPTAAGFGPLPGRSLARA